jgi:tripartite-type tricarboxylate transporter receptor subunit TctC
MTNPSRFLRKALPALFAGAAALLAAHTAGAQDFGPRPVTLVVGFPPGGSNDLAARIFAPKLAESLGTSVVVVNKTGANATIGTDFVAKSAPDAHTLLVASASPLVIVPHTAAKIPYDTLKDFVAISMVGVTPGAIGVNLSVKARTLKELIESSKAKGVTIASTGNGGMPHLTIELLRKSAVGGNVLHVPYKGAALAVTDVMGAHVDGIVADLASLMTLFKDGKLRPMAITGRNRVDYLPEAPTAVEQGYPGLVAENWLGFFAPAKTPKALTDKLYAAIAAIGGTPQVKEQLIKVGYTPVGSASPEAFQQFLREEFEKWGKVARESGARAD